jgi:hypothetical protein
MQYSITCMLMILWRIQTHIFPRASGVKSTLLLDLIIISSFDGLHGKGYVVYGDMGCIHDDATRISVISSFNGLAR